MNELRIHGVPADVIKALEADALRANSSVEEVAKRVLSQYAGQPTAAAAPQQARLEIDRIRTGIERRHGKLDVILPLLREDRNR